MAKEKLKIPKRPRKWRLKDVLKDLEARGAVEIPPAMLKKEPYKTYMRNVKRRNGKFICE